MPVERRDSQGNHRRVQRIRLHRRSIGGTGNLQLVGMDEQQGSPSARLAQCKAGPVQGSPSARLAQCKARLASLTSNHTHAWQPSQGR